MKVLYRIVNALLAAAIFPVIIFADLINFYLSLDVAKDADSSMIAKALETLGLGEAFSMVGVQETISVKFIIDVITGKEEFWHDMIIGNSSGASFWTPALDPIKSRLIAVAVALVVAILIALFVIVWSIISNKRLPMLISGVAGLVSCIVMTACFNSLAGEFTSGAISVASLIPSTNFLVNLVAPFITVDRLTFAGFHSGMIMLFIGMIIWTLSYYLVEMGETPEEKAKEKEKELLKAQAKAERKLAKAESRAERKLAKAEAKAEKTE